MGFHQGLPWGHLPRSSPTHASLWEHVRQAPPESKESEVLAKLRNIVDPDFGEDIVSCGFIKSLEVDAGSGRVGVTVELTTPACPIKEVFEGQAREFIQVILVCSRQPAPQFACARAGTHTHTHTRTHTHTHTHRMCRSSHGCMMCK